MHMPRKTAYAEQPDCAANILKGDPCFYIATIDSTKSGRFIYMQYGDLSMLLKGLLQSIPLESLLRHMAFKAVSQGQMLPYQRVQVGTKPPQAMVWVIPFNHAAYASECEHWSKLSYVGSLAETISLDISVVHNAAPKRKGSQWYTDHSKKDIHAQIDAPGLIKIALDTNFHGTHGNSLSGMWARVDLSTHPANRPYFYTECWQASKRAGKECKVFKSKQFTLMVVVPGSQWRKYKEWLEKTEHATASPAMEQQLNLPSVEESVTTSKRAHQRSDSISITTPSNKSPPHKKFAAGSTSCSPSPSPNCEGLSEALRIGGTVNMDVRQLLDLQNENIQYYLIPTRPLTAMLKNPKFLSYDIETVECLTGQLTINPSMASILGAGAFKMAHPGWLTLFAPPSSGFGSKTCNDVAVKQAYYKAYPPGASSTSLKYKIGRYALPDEVHFVDAGIAFAFGPLPASKAASKWSASSAHAVYLVEELIPGGNDKFLKYIHNMDTNLTTVCQDTWSSFYFRLSRFCLKIPGSSELLTDPQILMHPTVSPGIDIFGDGNMEVAVSFGLQSFAKQADGSIDDTAKSAADGSVDDDAEPAAGSGGDDADVS
ncbi:uncharacterized protein EDB93DRAFT_1100196 [Suillus bovinus]|uniref:uncharacterized protein n=1 Tax=Suillus bovinus TaxID=48563 RepID=UPI001B871E66|nr:uncharacterized protein EDB93DRAFT_1100196 [Suillus bovinus]KAG2159186.1 hypothetical protein EDB93DRAFT_1100196 [Suillus bovinus]